MIEFRAGEPGDGALIAQTRQKCWATTYRGIFPDEVIDRFDYAWHTDRDEKRLRNPDFNYYLVLDDGICIGYFSYGTVKDGTFKDYRFRLQSAYLLREYRGRGLGRKIMEHVFHACRCAGFNKLFWECSPHNMQAMGFYSHLGAVMTEMDSGHINRQEDACYFEYQIT